MTAFGLLQNLEARGVALALRGGKLVVDAPVGALTVEDRDALCCLKPDLVRILEAGLTPDELPPDWHQLRDERAAIMEYEGGLPRERAEALALLDILGQMRRAGVSPRNDACI